MTNRDDDLLANHVATVQDFINHYRDLKNQQQHHLMSKHFTTYLVTCCHLKMHRQVGHWSLQGFIYCLSEVDTVALQADVLLLDSSTAEGRHNYELCKAVAENQDLIKWYILDNCSIGISELTHLIAACMCWMDNKQGFQHQLYIEWVHLHWVPINVPEQISKYQEFTSFSQGGLMSGIFYTNSI